MMSFTRQGCLTYKSARGAVAAPTNPLPLSLLAQRLEVVQKHVLHAPGGKHAGVPKVVLLPVEVEDDSDCMRKSGIPSGFQKE